MKRILFKTLAVIIGMAMSISLVSCGDDNKNDEPENSKAVAYYDVQYLTELNEDWFKFFDVTITYVNGVGKEVTEAIEMNKEMPTTKIEAAMAPNTINFKIHVARKATVPAVDPNLPYHFKGKASFFVQAYLKDNTKGASYGSFLPESTLGTTIGGKDMEKFLERYKDAYIFERSVEIKK